MKRCGTVAVIGRANAGKSTLVNVLVGEKVSIVSPKPQTTRDRIYGVLTTDGYQIVFEDTPGIYKAKSVLGRRMRKDAGKAAKETDAILFVADGHEGISDEDVDLLKGFIGKGTPVIAVLAKTDIMPKEKIPEGLLKLASAGDVEEIIPVSARKGKNVGELLETILKYLPESDYVFDPEYVSDKSEKFMVAEIMREKILLKYEKEIPHGVAVKVNEFSRRENGVYDVDLEIICERQNHKAIIIGKNGAALKAAASFAREDMEKFLGAKVFLKTFVKVKEDWRDKPELLEEYGYGKSGGRE
ncbi:MAG TPA: GTPase Era [Clostridiales bacterium]|nr:GTPase Era [Clostridiales bacterium]